MGGCCITINSKSKSDRKSNFHDTTTKNNVQSDLIPVELKNNYDLLMVILDFIEAPKIASLLNLNKNFKVIIS